MLIPPTKNTIAKHIVKNTVQKAQIKNVLKNVRKKIANKTERALNQPPWLEVRAYTLLRNVALRSLKLEILLCLPKIKDILLDDAFAFTTKRRLFGLVVHRRFCFYIRFYIVFKTAQAPWLLGWKGAIGTNFRYRGTNLRLVGQISGAIHRNKIFIGT